MIIIETGKKYVVSSVMAVEVLYVGRTMVFVRILDHKNGHETADPDLDKEATFPIMQAINDWSLLLSTSDRGTK